MSCGCKGVTRGEGADKPRLTRPDEACIWCAEKHFSTAWALARENGYESPNRQRLIGELILAQWHLWAEHRDFAEKLREVRHGVQHGAPPTAEAWAQLASSIGVVVDEERNKKAGK